MSVADAMALSGKGTQLAVLSLAALACHKQAPPSAEAGATTSVIATLGEPATDSAAVSAARFTQAFYERYSRQGNRFEAAVRDSPAFFAPELLHSMREDLRAQARSPDAVVGLDWDPFLATQDPCEPYRVGRTTRRGDTILVAVKGMCTDRRLGPDPDVIAEVGRTNARWIFLDFRHVGDGGSLVQDLAQLRQGRAADSVRRKARPEH